MSADLPLDELDLLISHTRAALSFHADDDPTCLALLGDLGHLLRTRFLRFGGIGDIDEAIILYQSSLCDSSGEGWHHRPDILSHLADALVCRFYRYGRVDELSEAVAMYYAALDLLPEGDPRRVRVLEEIKQAENDLDGLERIAPTQY
ncbi:uncharacterized protein FOMMEDRAFT_148311 [Fomitiporia mediterranea MF3/22]|uniref:uncharacterized protein n=1 Tax=Fomitiporia mediterranea (strain MF3/22) TaxID=694068 RepID=UPI0004409B7E|nr:uncharacterized protein FOMMEDRAFT_148311 [Fomitiporia mediterranea MF3/22]EJD00627.1 hypothetical protein FOMMEDRAFT_148311 [Fomitiporia mediterranea MF3/22]